VRQPGCALDETDQQLGDIAIIGGQFQWWCPWWSPEGRLAARLERMGLDVLRIATTTDGERPSENVKGPPRRWTGPTCAPYRAPRLTTHITD